MTIYSEALRTYLGADGDLRQEAFAQRAGCTQAAISRYAAGGRFPDRQIAEKIERASGGSVPMTLWRVVAAERAGLAA